MESINPWDEYGPVGKKVQQTVTPPASNDPWAEYGPIATKQAPVDPNGNWLDQETRKIKNRINNIGTVVGIGINLATHTPLNPTQAAVLNEFKKGQEIQGDVADKVGHDVTHMFSNVNLAETGKKIFDKSVEGLSHPLDTLGSAAVGLAKMPYNIVEGLAGASFGAFTGVDMSGNEIKAMNVDEAADATKSFIGNAVGLAVAPVVSKMIGGALALSMKSALGGGALTTEGIEEAATLGVNRVAAMATSDNLGLRLGNVGRKMLDDVGAAAAAGIAQGAITDANKADVLSSMAAGLMFAPIGAATGYIRGLKEGKFGELETAQVIAKDVQKIRNFQAVNSVNEATKKVVSLLSSDDVDRVLSDIMPTKPGEATDFWKTLDPKERASILQDQGGTELTAKDRLDVAKGHYELGKSAYDIDNLFKKFSETLNETDSFTSSLVQFAEKHGLTDKLNDMGQQFVKMEMERVNQAGDQGTAHLVRLNEMLKAEVEGKFQHPDDIHLAATRGGFYVNDNHGLLEIRDIETGKVVNVAHTTTEALDLMKTMGDDVNVPSLDAGAKMPTGGVEVPHGPAMTRNTAMEWEATYNNMSGKVAAFDLGEMFNKFTSMRSTIDRVDRMSVIPGETVGRESPQMQQFKAAELDNGVKSGSNLKHNVLLPLERVARITALKINEAFNSRSIMELDKFVRSKVGAFKGLFDNTDLEHVSNILEAQSRTEMEAPGGYIAGFTPTKAHLDLANFMHDNNVDASLVLNYRRVLEAAKFAAIKAAEVASKEGLDINIQALGLEQATKIYSQAVDSWQTHPEYLKKLQDFESYFKPDENFKKAAQMYDGLFTSPDHTTGVGFVARYKLALDHPEIYDVTKDEYIANHNIRPDVVKLHDMVKAEYDKRGNEFGVREGSKIMRYMNHARQIGDVNDIGWVDSFERGIMDGGMKEFASAMVRTGEIANYSKNPITNLYSYIRGGVKAQELYPMIKSVLQDEDGALAKEMMKINNPEIRTLVKERFEQYARDITGQNSLSAKQAQVIQAHYLRNVVLNEAGERMSVQDIINEMQKPDHMDTLMNLSSAGLLGGRVSLAMRDTFDMWQKYYVRHDGKQLWNMWRTKVDAKLLHQLIEDGRIVDPEPVDRYNVTHQIVNSTDLNTSVSAQINAASKELATFGFKTSYQGQVYLTNQAKIWISTSKLVRGVIEDIASNKITKEEGYKKLFINKFDEQTQKLFNAHVTDGNFGAATNLLAAEEVHASAGTMTRGNQPPIMNSKMGKLFGQMGSWGMANRTTFEDMMTRGTREEVAGSMTRYGTSIAATVAAGQALGLNLGRWMLIPTALIATGGPVMGTLQQVTGAATASLGDNENQQKYTNRALRTAVTQYLPFSYAIADVNKGVGLAERGNGFGLMRPAAQMMGIGVNTTNRNMLDMITGNHPIPPMSDSKYPVDRFTQLFRNMSK